MINGIYQHMRYSKRLKTADEGIAEAQKTYGQFFPKHEAYITRERVPGVETGHLAGLQGEPFDVRQQYTEAGETWRTPENRDVLLDALDIPQREVLPATGFFDTAQGLEINPAEVSRPLVPLSPGGEATPKGRRLDPQSSKMMQALEAFRSYVEAQDMGAFHKTFPISSSGAVSRGANSLRISGLDRAVTEEEMRQLAKIVGSHPGVMVSDTGQGVTLMHFLPDEDESLRLYGTKFDWDENLTGKFPEGMKDLEGKDIGGKTVAGQVRKEAKAREKAIAPQVEALFPENVGVQRVGLEAEAMLSDKSWQPTLRKELEGTGAATKQLLSYFDDPMIPDLLNRLDADPRIRKIVQSKIDTDIDFATRLGLPIRDDLQRAREIIASGGLAQLMRELQKGAILPAVGLPFIVAGTQGVSLSDNRRQ
jgi:hypothetical protein